MKKGDISINLIFTVILVVIAVAAGIVIIGLVSGKGGDLMENLRNIISVGV